MHCQPFDNQPSRAKSEYTVITAMVCCNFSNLGTKLYNRPIVWADEASDFTLKQHNSTSTELPFKAKTIHYIPNLAKEPAGLPSLTKGPAGAVSVHKIKSRLGHPSMYIKTAATIT